LLPKPNDIVNVWAAFSGLRCTISPADQALKVSNSSRRQQASAIMSIRLGIVTIICSRRMAALPLAVSPSFCSSYSSTAKLASMGTIETRAVSGDLTGMRRPGAFHARRSAVGR
jgi:hypothetical protein